MSRIMSEEASLYFAAQAALAEEREEVRFGGRPAGAGALQAWLRRAYGAVDWQAPADGPAARVARLEIDRRVEAMLTLTPVAAAR
jgi:hypothetical protein